MAPAMPWNGSSLPPNHAARRGFGKRNVAAHSREPLASFGLRRNSLHVEQKLERLIRMRMPTKARYSVSLKTVLVGLGVALLSACSGGPTAPSATPVGRASGLAPVARMQMEYLRPIRAGQEILVTCAHLPGGEPKLECVCEIRDVAGAAA